MPTSTRSQDKRRDLLDGALAVFARDGYSRASIDGIAAAAGVSTRTIYNRFGDKASLFQAVIVDSAQRAAETQIAAMHQILDRIVDLESDLIEFGRIWAGFARRFPEHFALVRQVQAEVGHVPPAALKAWQRNGPLRVRAEITTVLARLESQGQLKFDDADIAAAHLVALASADVTNRTFYGALPMPVKEVHRLADAGVRAFLRAYRA